MSGCTWSGRDLRPERRPSTLSLILWSMQLSLSPSNNRYLQYCAWHVARAPVIFDPIAEDIAAGAAPK